MESTSVYWIPVYQILPVRQCIQIASKGWETTNRLGITTSADCDKQLARAYIDAGCIRMQDGNSSHRFFFAIGSPEYRSDAQGANQRQTPNRDRRQS